MRIGIIVPIGRIDKYGYQYLNEIIFNNLANFADHVLVISSSRHTNQQVFENYENLEFISNNNSWFKLDNGEEQFSFEIIDKNNNYCKEKLHEEGYDVAILIHNNQYIPKSSEKKLIKSCLKMIEKKEPYRWYYKKYMCGNLLFNADRGLPWILNLTIDNPWEYYTDAIKHNKHGNSVSIRTGNFKKYNNQAIRDVPWEMTIQDANEKYELFIREHKMREIKLKQEQKSFNIDSQNLKFNEKKWLQYMQIKLNLKQLSKEKLDQVGEQILKLRQENFISKILIKEYNPKS